MYPVTSHHSRSEMLHVSHSLCMHSSDMSCSVLSAGVKSFCAVNQEAVQTGGPTSPHQAKSSLCTHPIAPCSAFPSHLSPARVPDTLHTALHQTMDVIYHLHRHVTQDGHLTWCRHILKNKAGSKL